MQPMGPAIRLGAAWVAFLALLTYLVVTIATVSHKDLLLNSPVTLPVINANIPIVGFFQYAPAWLLIIYLSLLVQHVLLARKYRKFTDAITPFEMETRTEHPARERVHSYVFSQILAGPEPNRITNFVMQLIVYVTFTILPLLTLLFFQITFVPYHNLWVTYSHRIAVILGFVMLILLTPLRQHYPSARKRNIKVGPQAEAREASGTQVALILFLLPIILFFSWLIFTVPNEWIDRRLAFVAPTSVRPWAEDEANLLNPLVRRFVYDRLPDNENKGWWRRSLLPYRVFVMEDTDLGTVLLRERDLRFALLSRSDLHRAILTWADLRGATMWRTWGPGNLKDAQLQGAFLREARLQGAQMSSAGLQGADLSKAQLQGAELNYANLQGANLRGAQLQGADVASAEVWLVAFPSDLASQLPPPRGLPDVKTAPLPPEARAQLKQDLTADITDAAVLTVVLSRLDEILRNESPNWDDGASWTEYASTAKEPSAGDLARFHAELACADGDGSIANRMAARVIEEPSEAYAPYEAYAKAFSIALLDENCRGGKALSDETRAVLKNLVSLPE